MESDSLVQICKSQYDFAPLSIQLAACTVIDALVSMQLFSNLDCLQMSIPRQIEFFVLVQEPGEAAEVDAVEPLICAVARVQRML